MATESTITSARAWSPDVNAFAPADAVPDALILNTSTVVGRIEGDSPSVRVAYIDDAAAEIVSEGAAIDEADPGMEEVTILTSKVSQLIRMSREQYAQTGTPQQLAQSVNRAVTRAANLAYIAQTAPVAPAVSPVAGLVNAAGLLVPAGTPAATVTGNLDTLVDLLAALEAADATPSTILMSPAAWAIIGKMKSATDWNTSLIGAGTEPADRRLLGVPVVTTSALTGLTGLVIDRSAIVSAVGDVQVATSEHQYFSSDSVAIRCTWRFGHAIVRPGRIGKFVVA